MAITLDVINEVFLVGIKILIMSCSVLILVAKSRNSSAHSLHLLLLFTLCASLLVPILGQSLPTIAVPILPEFVAMAAQFDFIGGIRGAPQAASLMLLLVVLYLLVSACLMAKLLADLWQLRTLRSRSYVIPAGALPKGFSELTQQLSIRRPITLLCAPDLGVPVTWGYFRPQLALPGAYRSWSETRLRHVLLHELAHIRRGDWLTTVFSHGVIACLWPVPSLRALREKLFWYAEVACDDWVLRSGVSRVDYATSLLSFAPVEQSVLLGNRLIDPSQVFRRIDAVLDGARVYHSRRQSMPVFACIGLALLLPASALQLTPLQADSVGTVHLLPVRVAAPPQPSMSALPADVSVDDLQKLKADLLLNEQGVPVPPKPAWRVTVDASVPNLLGSAPIWQLDPDALSPALSPRRVVQVLPVYPKRALALGREGEVTVEFDITPSGAVVNERVIAATPAKVFDQAALNALRQFRYSPSYAEGRDRTTQQVREVFRFELNEDANSIIYRP